ncbi:hypothetical protein PCPL58_p4090 (plasmid) [Pseudomonas cerasi]|nr:hypothetical protein PCPL58_p4017 [Pseudomonas cerasi]CZT26351.1 hypothetical protein PCPL58_p4090 [Pseudomonas cerasi]
MTVRPAKAANLILEKVQLSFIESILSDQKV